MDSWKTDYTLVEACADRNWVKANKVLDMFEGGELANSAEGNYPTEWLNIAIKNHHGDYVSNVALFYAAFDGLSELVKKLIDAGANVAGKPGKQSPRRSARTGSASPSFIPDASEAPPDEYRGEPRMIPDPRRDNVEPDYWKRQFQGEWEPDEIVNPAFLWKPRLIPNPKALTVDDDDGFGLSAIGAAVTGMNMRGGRHEARGALESGRERERWRELSPAGQRMLDRREQEEAGSATGKFKQYAEVIEVLLRGGANINSINGEYSHPERYVKMRSMARYTAAPTALAQAFIRSRDGEEGGDVVCDAENFHMIQYLLTKGASFNFPSNRFWNNLLKDCALQGYVELVEILVNNGVYGELMDNIHDTVIKELVLLHDGRSRRIEELLEMGRKSYKEQCPYDYPFCKSESHSGYCAKLEDVPLAHAEAGDVVRVKIPIPQDSAAFAAACDGVRGCKPSSFVPEFRCKDNLTVPLLIERAQRREEQRRLADRMTRLYRQPAFEAKEARLRATDTDRKEKRRMLKDGKAIGGGSTRLTRRKKNKKKTHKRKMKKTHKKY